MGKVIEVVDTSDYDKLEEEVLEYEREERRQQERLTDTSAYNLVWLAKKYDDFLIDPVVGFFLPGIGDAISSVVTLPAIYVALFKCRSLNLTVAILSAMLIDVLVGAIPILGDICDAFHKSNKIAARLIVGYVERDADTISEINKRAGWGYFFIIVAVLMLWLAYSAVVGLYHWITGLI